MIPGAARTNGYEKHMGFAAQMGRLKNHEKFIGGF